MNAVAASADDTPAGEDEGGHGDEGGWGTNAVGASAETESEPAAGHGGDRRPAAVSRPEELPHATQVGSVSGDSLPQSGQSMKTS
jgi:hypothetical protein